jgi:hypothetical protein
MKNIHCITAAKKEGSLWFDSCVYKTMVSHYISVHKNYDCNEKYSAILYDKYYGRK